VRKIGISLIIALIALPFYGQDFAPPGAEWYYNEQFAFSGDIDYIRFTSEKDTLIFGETCRKIIKRHKLLCNDRPETEYLFTRNDTVFFLDTAFNEFQILYDFNATATDSWIIKIKGEGQETDTLTITVDAVSTTQINGHILKKLDVTYNNDGSVPVTYTSSIIEKIGDVTCMFNWYPGWALACDANYTSGLRCYQDTDIGLYSTGIAESCDYVYFRTGTDSETSPASIELHPNPAQDFVEIIAGDYAAYSVKLFDLNGRLLKSDKADSFGCILDVSDIDKGIYILLMQNDTQIIAFEKLIKE